MQNYFALFNLPEQFELDKQMLDTAYHTVQNQVHPDRFIHASESDKRAAMQWASLANDAYQTLRNPVKRAAHLCHIRGFPLDGDFGPAMPSDFIFEQIEWREHLDNARIDKDFEALETMDTRLRERIKEQLTLIEKELNLGHFAAALQEIRKMMFLQKFGDEINYVFDSLDKTD
jgi:molecular chaperone HscB